MNLLKIHMMICICVPCEYHTRFGVVVSASALIHATQLSVFYLMLYCAFFVCVLCLCSLNSCVLLRVIIGCGSEGTGKGKIKRSVRKYLFE
jgi:hypothetical protein